MFFTRPTAYGLFVVLLGSFCAWSQDPAELNSQGVDFYQAGNYAEAAKSLELAYELAPANPTIKRNLCNVYQAAANELAKQADFTSALKQLERAVALDRNNCSPLVQMGLYYLRLDMVADAIARLEDAITVAPYNIDAHELLGEAYYRDNDLPSARTQWGWVLQQQPDRPGLKERFAKAMREETAEAGFRPTGSFHFQVSSTPEVPGHMLQKVLASLEQAYAEIGRNFGGTYPPGPIQVIVYNAGGFNDATQIRQNVGALFDGKIRIPLVDAAGILVDEQDLRERLYHEYIHVVVRYLTQDKAAWWLNEGLAESFSRQMNGMQTELLQKAVESGKLFTYAGMEESQLNSLDGSGLRLAYTQSHATMMYLWQRFGHAKLVELMGALTAGASTEQALMQTYNRNYDTLFQEVTQFIVAGCQ